MSVFVQQRKWFAMFFSSGSIRVFQVAGKVSFAMVIAVRLWAIVTLFSVAVGAIVAVTGLLAFQTSQYGDINIGLVYMLLAVSLLFYGLLIIVGLRYIVVVRRQIFKGLVRDGFVSSSDYSFSAVFRNNVPMWPRDDRRWDDVRAYFAHCDVAGADVYIRTPSTLVEVELNQIQSRIIVLNHAERLVRQTIVRSNTLRTVDDHRQEVIARMDELLFDRAGQLPRFDDIMNQLAR